MAPSLATLTMPISTGDKLVGGLTLESHDPVRRFGGKDQRLLQTVAAAMGIALENARLSSETKEGLERQAADPHWRGHRHRGDGGRLHWHPTTCHLHLHR